MTRWFRTDIGRALAFFSSWSALWLTACEGGILDVDDSGIVVPADLDEAGPAAIPTLVNGVVGSYHEAVDGVVRYSAMLTDEMILAGTFPTRFQVDARYMLMASWVEGALIVAEVAVRSGQTAFAEALLNDLRSDYSLRATLEWGVDPPAAGNLLPEVQLSGDLVTDLKRVADERARELWLTGDRHTTARRLLRDPQTQPDLFPSKLLIGGGDDVAFPIPQIELDNNPNLGGGDACPAGQSAGSWR